MSHRLSRVGFSVLCAVCVVLFAVAAPSVWGQGGTVGSVVVTVLDQSSGVVGGAQLQLQDLSTNDMRNAATETEGTHSFVNLPIGTYKLTIAKTGFSTLEYGTVIVQAAQVTDIKATLKVASATGEKVEVVESATPLVDTTSNAIGTTIDMKQIEDLPLGGRSLTNLSTLVPGTANSSAGPTWNGLPVTAQGGNIDGVIGSTNRMKFSGNGAAPNATARIEDIAEMTVQTDQLDLNQGFGQSAMELNFVTRRGSNSFHGRAFEDFQNSYLNANSWSNDARGLKKNHSELNDFGGSVGGPIIKNKLFFFGTYAESKQPGTATFSRSVLSPAAQLGVFQYGSSTVCLFTNSSCASGIITQYNAAHGTSLATSNATVQAEQNNINTAALPLGTLSGTTDPNLNQLSWESPNPTTFYYPTVRVDYNMSQTFRWNFAWNMTKQRVPFSTAAQFPGTPFDGQGTGNIFKNYTAGLGFDWTISPALVNQFRGGYLYHYDGFGAIGFNNIENKYPTVAWAYGSSGQSYSLPTPDFYPVINASDTMTWQHGAHTLSYGFSFYREQDHYWNAPAGYAQYTLGLTTGDPALNAFTTTTVPGANSTQLGNIEGLYATLAGDVSNVGGQFAYSQKTGQYANTCCSAYDLDERSQAWGLFIQDSFRVRPNLTVNYGLRWDFTGANTDLTGAYHSVPTASLYGPSGVGNLFNSGSLMGTVNPQYKANPQPYNPWYVTPQPTIGVAWTPQFSDGFVGKLVGGQATVIRAGYALRNHIEPYQYMWDYATDQGQFYYQNFFLSPSSSPGAAGTYQVGSLYLNGTGNSQLASLPSFRFTPSSTYPATYPMSANTFAGSAFPAWGMEQNLPLPYVESWNLGIQRQLGNGNAIEIRYVGNRGVHQWLGLNINEDNIFQQNNPFLSQFEQAQANMRIDVANGVGTAKTPTTFADLGFPGQAPTPIFDAAFTGEAKTGVGGQFKDYSNFNTFLNPLLLGQAGSVASTLSRGTPTDYFCNLVGASFSPCATNLGFTGAGAGYPINYFQANPYNSGNSVNILTGGGSTTYNSLQVDFRQKQWHGMQFDANYTWAKNLGLATQNDWEASLDNPYDLRDMHLSYAPTLYDIRNSVNISGTYDLPFGKGKRFLSSNSMVDRVFGGWTLGTIFTYHSGNPFRLTSGYHTFNNIGEGGVVLSGISESQLQGAVGVFEIPVAQNGGKAATFIDTLNPSILTARAGGANTSIFAPNTSPGTFAPPIYLYGPRFINDNLAVTKAVPIRENLRFSLQGEISNLFNHPNFGSPDSGVLDTGFGTAGPASSARSIELRANFEF